MLVVANEEENLLRRLKDGDEASFRLIFDRYKNKLYTFSLRLTKSEELAEEIVHDVFLKVWLKRDTINPELSFNAFLFKITKNESLNFIKKASVDKKLKNHLINYLEAHHNETENIILSHDNDRFFQKAIDKLPPQQQAVFKMSRVEGKSHAEIAACLNLSKGTVKNYIMIAMSSVKRYFNIMEIK